VNVAPGVVEAAPPLGYRSQVLAGHSLEASDDGGST
jgi:hypothetical protein